MVPICEHNFCFLFFFVLSFQQFYCLPDNYEVIDSSLDDIKVGQITIFKMILSQVDQANGLGFEFQEYSEKSPLILLQIPSEWFKTTRQTPTAQVVK